MALKEAERRAYKEAAARDGRMCQRCGKHAWDVCHILPKGRYPSLRAQVKNLICLCRSCHTKHESYEGRCILLAYMQKRYGYEYTEDEYQGYLR